MQRVTLTSILPVILVLATLALFVHKWTGSEPEPDGITTATSAPTRTGAASLEGSGAQVPPSTSMDPAPAGTPAAPEAGNAPTSATPLAPSGDPARPDGAR